ncbi:MAG: heparinase II/III domain-containing protein, partial [Opitutaceae bacterium]
FHDDALFAFLKKQSERYDLPTYKGRRDWFVNNIDDRILRTIFNAVRGRQILGNEGLHQRAVASAAVALNTPPETTLWLDWLFDPAGGAIPGLIVGQLDRDGMSPEAAPDYTNLWSTCLAEVARILSNYTHYTKHDIFRDFPQFRATFTAGYRVKALGLARPNIGDTGFTGSVDGGYARADFIATGYRYTKDPALAIAAYRANGNSALGLGRDVFANDSDSIANDIERLGARAGPRPAGSSLLSGYGLALLESGTAPHGTAVSLYYGRSIHHGHADHLNFDLFAFGHWLAPDHGNPEIKSRWPHRTAVTANTLSHNTVVVDQKPQIRGYGGHTRLFQQLPGLSVVQIDARSAYAQTKEYVRTMLLIDAPTSTPPASPGRKTEFDGRSNTCLVDIFQVTGGADHLYSFHGPPGDITPTALALVSQNEGTYAGPKIPFKSEKGPLGYSWWYNVRRDASPPISFTLDWKTQSGYRGDADSGNLHVRFHSLTALNDVALADADPPQNKSLQPRRLGYALLHRTGPPGLASTFVSVIEPYRATPFITSVTRLDAGSDDQAVLRLQFVDGTLDHVLFSASGRPIKLEGAPALAGTLGFTRERNGQLTNAAAIHASELTYKDARLATVPAFTGTVVKMNRRLDGGGWIEVDTALPIDGTLVGQAIMIANDNERDACYIIRGVTRTGSRCRVDCGPISFVRDYAAPAMKLHSHKVASDYSQGYLYDFDEGARFVIPTAAVLVR